MTASAMRVVRQRKSNWRGHGRWNWNL